MISRRIRRSATRQNLPGNARQNQIGGAEDGYAGGFASDAIDLSAAQHFALRSEQPIAFYSLGLYFQDQYLVSQKLKLTLTLRADRNSSGVCQSNCTTLPSSPFDKLSHDSTIPYNQAFITGQHSILPNVEKVVFRGVGHLPYEECPDEFNRAMIEFLKQGVRV